MKYIKHFEEIEDDLQIGDYVICYDEIFVDDESKNDKMMNEFLENNIGQIINLNNEYYGYARQYKYVVEYKNMLKDLKRYFDLNNEINIRGFTKREILHVSKDKEELEAIIAAKKYNI